MIRLYLPNWLYPNNIGDTIVSTFIPKLLKKVYPNKSLEVVTHGKILDILKLDNNIDILRLPDNYEINLDFESYFLEPHKYPDIKVAIASWHSNLFKFWKDHHEFLVSHPTANILTVNFLLQLGLEDLLFNPNYDFTPYCNLPERKNLDIKNIAIVPSTKLAGKTSPHPGCNGIGYRYKLEHWIKFVNSIKSIKPNIRIYEFSENYLNIGDEHIPYSSNFIELIKQIDFMDLGIMSDGGLHHVFNCRKKPIVLMQSNILSKVEFLKLSNSYYPEHLHLQCRKSCRSYYSEVFNFEDLSKSCKMECEDLDPIKLARYTNDVIDNLNLKYKI